MLVAALLGLNSCYNKDQGSSKSLKVYRDTVFTSLFHKDRDGVTGADGNISVAFPDGSSLFMMGDSFLGKVVDNQRDPKTKMINNTFILINPENTDSRSLFEGEYNEPESLVVPPEEGKFYWPGHGFVRDGIFHFFMSKFEHSDDMWGFKFVSTDYFRYTAEGMMKVSTEPFTYTAENLVHWGHAVYDNGKYIYIYGSRVERDSIARAHVCRTVMTKDNQLDLFKVEFFDGKKWSVKPADSKPMLGTSSNISEQFSVFSYKNKFILLSQQRGIGMGEIYTYTSDSPFGPWDNRKMIYRTNESQLDKDIITYNAMAHPQYIKNDELLICYNINSLKVPRIFTNVNLYRPVFLRVPMQLICNKEN